MGIMMAVMEPFHEVHHGVSRRLILVKGTSQITGCRADVTPSQHHAGGCHVCGLVSGCSLGQQEEEWALIPALLVQRNDLP
jgi:hypothetical protein